MSLQTKKCRYSYKIKIFLVLGSSAELRPEEQEVLRVEPPVYERKEQVQESQLRLQPPVPQPNPIKLIVSIGEL